MVIRKLKSLQKVGELVFMYLQEVLRTGFRGVNNMLHRCDNRYAKSSDPYR